jgi:hypothetical protein
MKHHVADSFDIAAYADLRGSHRGAATVAIYRANKTTFVVAPAKVIKPQPYPLLEEFSIFGWRPTIDTLVQTAHDTLGRHGFIVTDIFLV